MSTEKRKNIVTGVVVSLAVLISLTFAIYAQVKSNQAEKNAMEALTQTDRAAQQRKRADELALVAQEAAAEALEAKMEADRIRALLEECQSK